MVERTKPSGAQRWELSPGGRAQKSLAEEDLCSPGRKRRIRQAERGRVTIMLVRNREKEAQKSSLPLNLAINNPKVEK